MQPARIPHRGGVDRHLDPCLCEPAGIGLGRAELFEGFGQIVEAIGDHRHSGGCDFVRYQPAFGHPDQHQIELGVFGLERQHRADIRRPVDRDIELLLPRHDRHQCLGIEAAEEHLVILGDLGGLGDEGLADQRLRLAQGCAQQHVGGDAAAARQLRAAFAEGDHLEGARLHHRRAVAIKVDDRALSGKDRPRRQGGGRRAGDPRRAVHEDVLRGRVDRRGGIERRAERGAARRDVVRFAHGRDIGKAERSDGGEQAGGDPCAARVDRHVGLEGLAGGRLAGEHHLAVIDDHHPAFDRFGAVADHEAGIGDHHVLREGRGGKGQRAKGDGAEAAARNPLHFTSPSPGWPSSKSVTGLRLGSLASNISAPSIHTFSGRE